VHVKAPPIKSELPASSLVVRRLDGQATRLDEISFTGPGQTVKL